MMLMQAICMKAVTKKERKRKETVLKYNFSLTKSSQQRKTARHYKTLMKSNIVSIGFYVWLCLTRLPANRLLVEALCQGSTNFFVRQPHKLSHNSPRAGHLT